jgi:hypothetical protein
MARKSKASLLAAPFQGRWRIAEMDLWDNETIDLVEPAFLEIEGGGRRDALHRRPGLARHPL